MTTRQATDTIKGYLYQFDYTIHKILDLSNYKDSVTIEGIEDVDIESEDLITAIQCKYYSKTEYNHSVIGRPIRLMLQDFHRRKSNSEKIIMYKLYGHFKKGESKLSFPIHLNFLKNYLLTYTRNKKKIREYEILSLTDKDLEEFLDNLIIDINAVEYLYQYSSIIDLLKRQFSCDTFTAENYYYNNALKVIKDCAILDNQIDRKITKESFVSKIDNRKILFNKWFILFKGKEKLFKEIKSKHFSSLNISPYDRFFLIEIDNTNYQRSDLKQLLLKISKNWTNISRRNGKPYCPYIFMSNLDSNELIEIKKEFSIENIIFIDGFSFSGADFSVDSINIKPNHNNGIQLKIINDINYIHPILRRIKNTREIYQFYITESFFELDEDFKGLKHTKIQVENINDIGEII